MVCVADAVIVIIINSALLIVYSFYLVACWWFLFLLVACSCSSPKRVNRAIEPPPCGNLALLRVYNSIRQLMFTSVSLCNKM